MQNLLDRSIQAFRAEYSELSDNWRDLDSKAQGTVAIAGIFLAAAFAFVEQASGSLSSLITKSLLAAAVVVLVLGIVFALISLWVRTVLSPPLGAEFHRLVTDLMKVDSSEREGRMENLCGDEIDLWRQSSEHLQKVNETKAKWVVAAQSMLLIAIAIVCLLTIAAIVQSAPQGGA